MYTSLVFAWNLNGLYYDIIYVPLNTHHETASPLSQSRVTDEIIHGITLKLEATRYEY